MSYQEEFIQLLYTLPAVLLAIVCHECAHGQVSVWLGDDTPKRQGRLSLNPLKHLDPVGVICLVVFKFGWARPVQVNPRAYKNGKAGMALVALAGPVTNFILAFTGCLVYTLLWKQRFFFQDGLAVEVINYFLLTFMSINLGLGVFNLIPIPPLDGSKILGAVLPNRYYATYMRFERYGTFLLMGLILLGNVLNIDLLPIGAVKEAIWDWMLNLAVTLTGV